MVKKKSHFRSNLRSRKRILLSAVLAVLLLYSVVLLLLSVFSLSSPYLSKTVPYDFSVKDTYAFNVDSDSLHFGGGPGGTTLKRSLSFSAQEDSKVVINWDGPGILSVDKNDFRVAKGENTSIMFHLIVPGDLSIGSYNGTITINFFE